MNVNQLYNVLNSINENTTIGAQNVVDTSTFINYGTLVLSSATNREIFYNKLVDRIGKTVFAIRAYKRQNRNITVDSFTFGSILQKISFKLQNSEENSSWNTQALNPYTLTPKQGIEQKLFAQDMPTFAYTDVWLDHQLKSAFLNEQTMAGFFNGLAERMYNALEVSAESLDNQAVCALVAEVSTEVAAGTNARRGRNLLAEYKTVFPQSTLTAATCLRDEDFLKFACIEMGTIFPFIEKLTSMYNDGTVERTTSRSDLVVEVNAQFEQMYNVYLKSNTFHDEMVALPNFTTVPYWYSPAAPMEIKVGPEDEAKTISGVIAIYRDKDAVVDTLENEKFVSKYDEFNERTYVKLSADRRYIVDTSENCIYFYVADVASQQ